HKVAIRRVAVHLTIPKPPGQLAFRIEPDDLLGALSHITQHPFMRQIIIIPGISKDQHSRAFVDHREIVPMKRAKRPPEVRVRVDVDDISPQGEINSAMNFILFKESGDVTQISDKNEAAHASIKILHRIDKL